MLFSRMTGPDVAAFDGDAARFICGLDIEKYHPATAMRQSAPSAKGMRTHLFDRFAETSILSVVGGNGLANGGPFPGGCGAALPGPLPGILGPVLLTPRPATATPYSMIP